MKSTHCCLFILTMGISQSFYCCNWDIEKCRWYDNFTFKKKNCYCLCRVTWKVTCWVKFGITNFNITLMETWWWCWSQGMGVKMEGRRQFKTICLIPAANKSSASQRNIFPAWRYKGNVLYNFPWFQKIKGASFFWNYPSALRAKHWSHSQNLLPLKMCFFFKCMYVKITSTRSFFKKTKPNQKVACGLKALAEAPSLWPFHASDKTHLSMTCVLKHFMHLSFRKMQEFLLYVSELQQNFNCLFCTWISFQSQFAIALPRWH